MNGELEVLRGTQADLRNAGAGSDILGPIGKQIGAIQKASDAMSGPNGPIAPGAHSSSKLLTLSRQRVTL